MKWVSAYPCESGLSTSLMGTPLTVNSIDCPCSALKPRRKTCSACPSPPSLAMKIPGASSRRFSAFLRGTTASWPMSMTKSLPPRSTFRCCPRTVTSSTRSPVADCSVRGGAGCAASRSTSGGGGAGSCGACGVKRNGIRTRASEGTPSRSAGLNFQRTTAAIAAASRVGPAESATATFCTAPSAPMVTRSTTVAGPVVPSGATAGGVSTGCRRESISCASRKKRASIIGGSGR